MPYVSYVIPEIPGIPGNDVCIFPIRGNEKTGPGMDSLVTTLYVVVKAAGNTAPPTRVRP